MPTITLTTDFGTSSPYVAAMKGVVLSICPQATLIDLGHDLPPQDIDHAAYFLAQAVPYFPAGTIHVAVVDPGVGSKRALLLAEAGGQFLFAPDNGVLTFVLKELGSVREMRRLTEKKFWRPDPSATFHGRDILAPAAAHLALGATPDTFGPLATDWHRLVEPEATPTPDGIDGRVVFVDRFGNLMTNIFASDLTDGPATVQVGNRTGVPVVRTYGDAPPGTLVALVGSSGRLELAVVNGNAQAVLHAGANTPIRLHTTR